MVPLTLWCHVALAGPWQSRRTLFIETQTTPNPDSLMFLPGQTVLPSGTWDCSSPREAMPSPLAITLFRIDGTDCGGRSTDDLVHF